MDNKPFSIRDRLKSFKYAFNGFKVLFRSEHNARIHLFFAILACIFGVLLDISASEWVAILILIALVIGAEILNTCIEKLCDYISPDWHEQIKIIKDLAAAAVLFAVIIAIVCGAIIFLPKLIALI